MTTDNETEQSNETYQSTIGQQLQNARKNKGYSIEYVAGKLHLREQILTLIESDDFDKLPQPVFIKGYIRAFAKCVETDPDNLIEIFNHRHAIHEPIQEAFLWQKNNDIRYGLNLVKWITVLSITAVAISVSIWWKKAKLTQNAVVGINAKLNEKQIDKQQQLTDLNKMSSVIILPAQESERG